LKSFPNLLLSQLQKRRKSWTMRICKKCTLRDWLL
jgi:hypothetical protein